MNTLGVLGITNYSLHHHGQTISQSYSKELSTPCWSLCKRLLHQALSWLATSAMHCRSLCLHPMHTDNQQESLDHARLQDLAPATPGHSQQDGSSSAVHSDREVTSGISQALQRHSGSGHVQANLCRADLSGAALLIGQELAVFPAALMEQSERELRQGKKSPSKQRKAFENGNYNRYYGYRLAQGETEDPRLQVGHAHRKKWSPETRLSSCLGNRDKAAVFNVSTFKSGRCLLPGGQLTWSKMIPSRCKNRLHLKQRGPASPATQVSN